MNNKGSRMIIYIPHQKVICSILFIIRLKSSLYTVTNKQFMPKRSVVNNLQLFLLWE